MKTQQHTENLNTRFLSGVSKKDTHQDDTSKVPHSTEVNNFWKMVSSDKKVNETQYSSNVPVVACNFYSVSCHNAQKWLKDQKYRELSYDDILHYQKIIVALTVTDSVLKEINEMSISK